MQAIGSATVNISQSSGTLDVQYTVGGTTTNTYFPSSSVTAIHVRDQNGGNYVTVSTSVTEGLWGFASSNDSIIGGPGSDYLQADGSSDVLEGGGTDDTYALGPNADGSDTIEDGNDTDGNATLNFSQFLSGGVNVNLGTTSPQAISSNGVTLTLDSATGIDNFIGTVFSDTVTTNSLDDTLDGGGAAMAPGQSSSTPVGDRYIFANPASAVSDTIIDSSGTATLDFSQLSTGIDVNIGSTSPQVVNSGSSAPLTLNLSSATGIQTVKGTSGNDTITGNSLNDTLNGSGGTDVLNGTTGNNTLEGTVGSTFLGGPGRQFDRL